MATLIKWCLLFICSRGALGNTVNYSHIISLLKYWALMVQSGGKKEWDRAYDTEWHQNWKQICTFFLLFCSHSFYLFLASTTPKPIHNNQKKTELFNWSLDKGKKRKTNNLPVRFAHPSTLLYNSVNSVTGLFYTPIPPAPQMLCKMCHNEWLFLRQEKDRCCWQANWATATLPLSSQLDIFTTSTTITSLAETTCCHSIIIIILLLLQPTHTQINILRPYFGSIDLHRVKVNDTLNIVGASQFIFGAASKRENLQLYVMAHFNNVTSQNVAERLLLPTALWTCVSVYFLVN